MHFLWLQQFNGARERSSMVPTEAPTSHQLVVASMGTLIESLIDPTHGAGTITRVKILL